MCASSPLCWVLIAAPTHPGHAASLAALMHPPLPPSHPVPTSVRAWVCPDVPAAGIENGVQEGRRALQLARSLMPHGDAARTVPDGNPPPQVRTHLGLPCTPQWQLSRLTAALRVCVCVRMCVRAPVCVCARVLK